MHGLHGKVAPFLKKSPLQAGKSEMRFPGMGVLLKCWVPLSSERLDAFPQTAWTRVLTAQDGQAPEARIAREEVCGAYWPPVYSYFRALGCGREDALDLTQELLADFCEGGGLDRVAQEMGSLRSYLKSTARHRLVNLRRNVAAQKRGGGTFHLALDELDDSNIPVNPAMADAYYDRRWAWTIFRRAMDRLAASYASRGKDALFNALKSGLISLDALKPYAEIGAAFGVGEAQIKLEVFRARKRLAETLRQEVAATLSPDCVPADAEAELRYLLKVLAHGT